MSVTGNAINDPRLVRGAGHLHTLGPRATAEFFIDLAARIGGMPTIIWLLNEYQQRLTPAMLVATGGDKFPPRALDAVPQEPAA